MLCSADINDGAFFNCTGVKEVHIKDMAAWCGNKFESSEATPLSHSKKLYVNNVLLTELVIPNGVTSIGAYAFTNCKDIMSVVIPQSVTAIGENAFSRCEGIKDVYIFDIGRWCEIDFANGTATPLCYAKALYLNNKLLTNLVVPQGVTVVGNYAFYNCKDIKSVILPDTVTEIGDYAFYGCGHIPNITFPKKLTRIGYRAFYECRGLTSVDLPEGLLEIGEVAFEYCFGLERVTIPKSVTVIGSSAFHNCGSLEDVYISDLAAWCAIKFGSDSANPLSNGAKLWLNGTVVTDLVIPDSATEIGDYAFVGCGSLQRVSIHKNVTKIGTAAFRFCENLKSIRVEEDNRNYSSDSVGVLFNKAKTVLLQAPGDIRGNYMIPDGVVTVDAYSFLNCDGLSDVIFPDSVTRIEERAFTGCTALTKVSLGKNINYLGHMAFYNCTGVKRVVLPDALASTTHPDTGPDITVYSNTFGNCTSLTSIVMPKTYVDVGAGTFYGCENVKTIYYTGSQEDWEKVVIDEGNDSFETATVQFNYSGMASGDLNDDGEVTDADAVYLLYHTFVPGLYPVDQDCDFNGDGEVNDADAVYLLYYTFLPNLYPLH